MDGMYILLLAVLVPVAVYGLAIVIFTAYFRAKSAFMKRLFHESDKIPNHNGE